MWYVRRNKYKEFQSIFSFLTKDVVSLLLLLAIAGCQPALTREVSYDLGANSDEKTEEQTIRIPSEDVPPAAPTKNVPIAQFPIHEPDATKIPANSTEKRDEKTSASSPENIPAVTSASKDSSEASNQASNQDSTSDNSHDQLEVSKSPSEDLNARPKTAPGTDIPSFGKTYPVANSPVQSNSHANTPESASGVNPPIGRANSHSQAHSVEVPPVQGVHFSAHAQTYINQNKLQEAIWISNEEGNTQAADELTADLDAKMRSWDYEIHEAHLGGATTKTLMVYASGIKGLFKGTGGTGKGGDFAANANSEVAAYLLDTKILKFNIVPMTMTVSNKAGYFGSVQYFVQGRLTPGAGRQTQTFKSMATFDYIAGNSDRHDGNWLYFAEEDRIIAIDHGLAFRRFIYAYEDYSRMGAWMGVFRGQYVNRDTAYNFKRDQDVSQLMRGLPYEVQQRILNTDESFVSNILSPYMDKIPLERLLSRFRNLKLVLQGRYSEVQSTFVPYF